MVAETKSVKKNSNNSPKEKERSNLEQVVVEVDGKVETHVHLSPHTPAGDPPEPEELIKAIQDLENTTASADEGVRQRIAQLPPEVSNVSVLSKIEGNFLQLALLMLFFNVVCCIQSNFFMYYCLLKVMRKVAQFLIISVNCLKFDLKF